MAPFVAVARVDAGADETVPDIKARAERRLHVRAVVRVHVERVVGALFLGRINELAHDLVAVGPAGILDADGDLLFCARKPVSHAAHVHADGLRHAGGNRARPAVADLFVDRHMRVDPSCGRFAGVMQVFCQPQQHADGELVV